MAAFPDRGIEPRTGTWTRRFDVILANPPYYANSAIAQLFLSALARAMLKPDGRFYLVTKQVEEIADLMMETFEQVEAMMHRGYTILSNTETIVSP